MIIDRYIVKNICMSFIAIICILLFIMLSNKFVFFLAKAAAGKLPVTMLIKVIGLYIPELLGLLAPIALFIAILFTYSRLYTDNEIAVLLTSGFNWWSLTSSTIIFSLIVSFVVGIINLFCTPYITAKREQIINDGQSIGILHTITPGHIQMVNESSDMVFYVEDVLKTNNILRNIFIADSKHNVIITARNASIQQLDNNLYEFFLILQNGYRYVGIPGKANYSIIKFDEYGKKLKFSSNKINDNILSTSELLASSSVIYKAELQWRLAMPVAAFILALLAIPIAKVNPRQGRFAKFLPAALVYMMYYNLLTLTKRWIMSKQISLYPGLWIIHLAFFLLAIAWLLKVSGRWYEYYRSIHR